MTRAQIIAKINARQTGVANRIAAERELWTIFMDEACKLYEVKEIDVNLTLHPTFIADNFDASGLGLSTGSFEGFAICNGNNGTQPRTGRAAIGYGIGYEGIGDLIGSADSVVVSHEHNTVSTVSPGGEYNGTLKHTAAYRSSGGGAEYGLQGTATVPTTGVSSTSGVSGVGKNIPPSIITLMIQRIA